VTKCPLDKKTSSSYSSHVAPICSSSLPPGNVFAWTRERKNQRMTIRAVIFDIGGVLIEEMDLDMGGNGMLAWD